MNRVAAEIAQEIGVLLQHDHLNASVRQELAEREPSRSAADDATLARDLRHHKVAPPDFEMILRVSHNYAITTTMG